MDSINKNVQSGTSVAVIFFSIISVDPSGAALKFNQFLNLMRLFKLFGFWFGLELSEFLETVAPTNNNSERAAKRILSASKGRGEQTEVRRGSKPSSGSIREDKRRGLEARSPENRQNWLKSSQFDRRKFNKYQIGLSYQGVFLYQTVFYLALWVGKIIGILIFRGMKKNPKSFKKWKIYYVVYARKLHFAGFGVVLSDLAFFSCRILLHRKNNSSGVIAKGLASLTLTLLSVDFIETFWVSFELSKTSKHTNYLKYLDSAANLRSDQKAVKTGAEQSGRRQTGVPKSAPSRNRLCCRSDRGVIALIGKRVMMMKLDQKMDRKEDVRVNKKRIHLFFPDS